MWVLVKHNGISFSIPQRFAKHRFSPNLYHTFQSIMSLRNSHTSAEYHRKMVGWWTIIWQLWKSERYRWQKTYCHSWARITIRNEKAQCSAISSHIVTMMVYCRYVLSIDTKHVTIQNRIHGLKVYDIFQAILRPLLSLPTKTQTLYFGRQMFDFSFLSGLSPINTKAVLLRLPSSPSSGQFD